MKHKFVELVPDTKRPISYDTYYKNLDGLENGGWLLNTKIVVLDFDAHNDEEKEKLEIITNYILSKYPTFWVQANRGKHLYYLKPEKLKRKIQGISVLGFPVDYLTGKNQVEALKLNNQMRKTSDNFYNLDFNTLPELPMELYPVDKSKNNNMLAMGEGARNETLFKHLCCVKEACNIDLLEVANFVNTYVFKEKLGDKEINNLVESVKKRETQDKSFFDGKVLNVNKFAEILIKNNHVCRINNQLHVYKDGIYVTGNKEIESVMIKYIPNILSAKRNEVLKMLEILILKNTKLSSPNYIAFENGIYDLETQQLFDFNPDIVITNKIPWNYNEKAQSSLLENVLNNWVENNKELRLLIEEVIGMCMYRSNKISSCFILTGEKDNGKSTFIHLLKSLLGDKNYSSVSLEDIETRFKNADLYGKLANLGDDIGDKYIDDTATFKKLVTGETVQLERKGKDPFDFNNYGKLIFNANDIPRIKDKTGAVIDKRITILPFNAKFTTKNKDIDLKEKFEQAEIMETAVLIGIKAIQRVLKNKQFTQSEITNKAKDKYKHDNDVVAQFIEEYGAENIYLHNVNDILEDYQEFCKNNDFKSKSVKILNAGVKRILNCDVVRRSVKIGGKVTKVSTYTDKNVDM